MTAATVVMRGSTITSLRVRMGLDVSALAERAGCSRAHLSNIEAGRKQASPRVAKALAVALGVPMTTITRGTS